MSDVFLLMKYGRVNILWCNCDNISTEDEHRGVRGHSGHIANKCVHIQRLNS